MESTTTATDEASTTISLDRIRPAKATACLAKAAVRPAKTVVVVNGDPTAVDLLDPALDEGRYEMLFVDARDRAYSRIKRLQPDLVILYTALEDAVGFQLLTMLKMDLATRTIPVLTYTGNDDEPEADRGRSRSESEEIPSLPSRPAPRMN
jgi:PleD family two-component response regulator